METGPKAVSFHDLEVNQAHCFRSGSKLQGMGQTYCLSDVMAEVSRLGLIDPLIPKNERSTHEAQKRGLGKVLSAHVDEKFVVPSEDEEDQRVEFRLEKLRKRFENGKATYRYGFFMVDETESEVDDGPDDGFYDIVISQDHPKIA